MVVDAYVETGEPVGSRTLSRARRARPVARHHPQRHGRSRGGGAAVRAAYLGGAAADRGRAQALRQRAPGSRRPERGRAAQHRRPPAPPPARACRRRWRRRPRRCRACRAAPAWCVAPKTERPLKHIEFVPLAPDARARRHGDRGRAGREPAHRRAARARRPRPWSRPATISTRGSSAAPSTRRARRSSTEIEGRARAARRADRAGWSRPGLPPGRAAARARALIVKGQAKLLDDVTALADLERLRALFDMLETREAMVRLLDATRDGRGRADLYRRRQPAVRRRRLLDDRGALQQLARAGGRRDRRHRPDAPQLRADHPAGGLHREGDRPAAGIG